MSDTFDSPENFLDTLSIYLSVIVSVFLLGGATVRYTGIYEISWIGIFSAYFATAFVILAVGLSIYYWKNVQSRGGGVNPRSRLPSLSRGDIKQHTRNELRTFLVLLITGVLIHLLTGVLALILQMTTGDFPLTVANLTKNLSHTVTSFIIALILPVFVYFSHPDKPRIKVALSLVYIAIVGMAIQALAWLMKAISYLHGTVNQQLYVEKTNGGVVAFIAKELEYEGIAILLFISIFAIACVALYLLTNKRLSNRATGGSK